MLFYFVVINVYVYGDAFRNDYNEMSHMKKITFINHIIVFVLNVAHDSILFISL